MGRRRGSKAGPSDVQRPTVSPGGLTAAEKDLLARRDKLMSDRALLAKRDQLMKDRQSGTAAKTPSPARSFPEQLMARRRRSRK